MEELKKEIQALIAKAGVGSNFAALMEGFTAALARHPQALGALAGSYRLQTTDTGLAWAFALSADGLRLLGAEERVDAAISGKEADLMALIRRELNPMAAMFTGKLRVQGSMQALAKFSELL